MRVLFTTVAEKAHLYAQVPLAWALRAAGHQVRIACPPDLADEITSTGLTALPAGAPSGRAEKREQYRRWIEESDPTRLELLHWHRKLRIGEPHPESLSYDRLHGLLSVWGSVFQNIAPQELMDDLVLAARSWRPHLVVWDPMMFAGPVAARACGAAHARLLPGFDVVARLWRAHRSALERRPPRLREDPLEEWLAVVARRYGGGFDEEMVLGQWTLDPMPSSMRLPADVHYVPLRHVPYNGPAVVPRWLRDPPGGPRVCLTAGVSHEETGAPGAFSTEALLDAVAEVDAQVVATLEEARPGTARRLPGNVRPAGFVPLNELLPTCAAIVHHGGFGTFQSALAHGVPQLILPDGMIDNELRADAVERSGAGLSLRRPGQLAGGLARTLADPSFARAAGRLRDEQLAAPAPRELVPILEGLTADHGD
ncbi:activator-dependent family glycosyltransferase [Actinomadura viridis]|uniref:activator-dependent family glycosyltransferase n=1 Tax=Actinomadura viridis TaxID=58110 RepID=UPI003684F702